MGTYPVFVKASAVRAAGVHPVIFQAYKSAWVMATGLALVAARVCRGETFVFAFTWWAVAAAVTWVLAGMSLIGAVPRVGVGAAVLFFDGCSSLLSFLAFTLAFHEPIKAHMAADGSKYYTAPYYLAGALIGMGGLVGLPAMLSQSPDGRTGPGSLGEPLLRPSKVHVGAPFGYLLAVLAGALSALQYGFVTTAKRAAPAGPYAAEALDALGSWTLTFGASACVVNACVLALVCATTSPRPQPHTRVVFLPGSGAGVLYCWSMLLTTISVQRGGNAITLAQRNATSLVVSGAWGLFYYREIRGRAALAWAAAAALTVASVTMLGLEKGG